jgi:hypothetical protein
MKTVRYSHNQLNHEISRRLNEESVFSSLGFCRLWRTVGGREVFWVLEDDNKPIAAMPGVEFGRWPVTRFQAMPDGCYARIIWLTDVERKNLQLIASLWSGVSGCGYVKTYITDYGSAFTGPDGSDVVERCASVVDISSADWQPPDARLVKQIEKAQQTGLVVEPYDHARHFEQFTQLRGRSSEQRELKPRYPLAFYQALADLARQDDRVWWLCAIYKGRVVASHIHLLFEDTILNWQLFLDREFSTLRTTQLLLFSAATRARESGIRFMNMGESPLDAEGLIKFKQRWGGYDHHYRTYVTRSRLGRLL